MVCFFIFSRTCGSKESAAALIACLTLVLGQDWNATSVNPEISVSKRISFFSPTYCIGQAKQIARCELTRMSDRWLAQWTRAQPLDIN
jgi:hypothetical protein